VEEEQVLAVLLEQPRLSVRTLQLEVAVAVELGEKVEEMAVLVVAVGGQLVVLVQEEIE
jgi:hypothetical protein